MAVWWVPKLGIKLLEYFGTRFGQFRDCLGGLCDNFCNKLWFGCCWAGNDHRFWFHKLEPMLGEKAVHGTVKNSPGLLDWTENGPCVFQEKYYLN